MLTLALSGPEARHVVANLAVSAESSTTNLVFTRRRRKQNIKDTHKIPALLDREARTHIENGGVTCLVFENDHRTLEYPLRNNAEGIMLDRDGAWIPIEDLDLWMTLPEDVKTHLFLEAPRGNA